MNSADFKGKSVLDIPGRTFIIVIVVIFSSLSFTLGFLVGKNAKETRPEQVAQTPAPSINQPVPALTQQPAVQDTAPSDNVEQSKETKQSVEQIPAEKSEEKKPGGPVKEAAGEITDTDSDQKQPEGEGMYTVQLGAIKNKSEAESLKSKYEVKGYKIYLIVSTNKKHEKLYKIRVGRFKDRKDAEMLALKLKNNDGLNTFVTFTD